ncbi:MAG: hypothetical protein CVV49_03310 [Spirochaetae bacterium HGW-Spirochaetae-5]|nr:MAG: hypothetical protein CVV49_03310 [Spirochaetae bacterium HGW-Spirochaetae-5]
MEAFLLYTPVKKNSVHIYNQSWQRFIFGDTAPGAAPEMGDYQDRQCSGNPPFQAYAERTQRRKKFATTKSR